MAGEVNITKLNRPLGGSSKTFQSRGGDVPAARSKEIFNSRLEAQIKNSIKNKEVNRYAGIFNARPTSNSSVPANNGMNSMSEAMLGAQVASMGLQSVMGITQSIIGLFNSKSAGGGPAVLKSAATLQGVNSAAITGMQSATTASDLRAAINNAENQIETLNVTISEIEPQLEKLKEASDKAKVEIGKLDEEISAKNSEISKKQTEKTQAQGAVDGCKAKLE